MGVSFKPQNSAFAVWDTHGKLRLHANDPSVYSDCVASSTYDRQPIQSLAWGYEGTANLVFTTSASREWGHYSGFHRAFDVESASIIYSIDNEYSGECLDISPRGKRFDRHCNETNGAFRAT